MYSVGHYTIWSTKCWFSSHLAAQLLASKLKLIHCQLLTSFLAVKSRIRASIWNAKLVLSCCRFAKRKLDESVFLGNRLQVTYAPQFESPLDTKEKLEVRRKEVLGRIKCVPPLNFLVSTALYLVFWQQQIFFHSQHLLADLKGHLSILQLRDHQVGITSRWTLIRGFCSWHWLCWFQYNVISYIVGIVKLWQLGWNSSN